jgi:hypothetical protein
MAIPISTTTISVLRGTEERLPYTEQDPYGEGYGDTPIPGQAWQIIASGVRAVIGTPSGSEQAVGGQQVTITCSLISDPVDCIHTDRVVDESDSTVYEVVWTAARSEFGITRTIGDLRRTIGTA